MKAVLEQKDLASMEVMRLNEHEPRCKVASDDDKPVSMWNHEDVWMVEEKGMTGMMEPERARMPKSIGMSKSAGMSDKPMSHPKMSAR